MTRPETGDSGHDRAGLAGEGDLTAPVPDPGAGFFAVGVDTFVRSCGLGLNPASALLVLARGSGRDNITTKWSAQAVAARLGMRWRSAKEAIEALEGGRIVKRDKDSSRPRYTIQRKGRDVWLPNALMDGVASETPPIARLRQTQDVMALRLLVELYGSQNLREDGGISPTVFRWRYERERLGEYGQYIVWRFFDGTLSASHRKQILKPHFVKEDESSDYPFWSRHEVLHWLGLLEWVPYLYEGQDGEPIHALNCKGSIADETALYSSCTEAATRCLTEWQLDRLAKDGGIVAPVPRHIGQAALIGIGRLRYRPRTKLTGAWWVNHVTRCREFAASYDAIAQETPATKEAAS